MTWPLSIGWVSSAPMALTTRGCTRIPPLTIAAYAWASWIGVTAMPWPKEPFARSISCHGSTLGSRRIPPTSLATSMPVGEPKPILRHVSYRIWDDSAVVLPSLSATLDATTLRDHATPSWNVSMPIALWSASDTCALPPSTTSVPESLILVVKVTVPLPRAAIAVSSLNTDPGS